MKKLLVLVLVVAIAIFAWLALPKPDPAQAPGSGEQTASGSGLVQGIDRERGLVTIAHGPMPALNMMPMTMSYAVRDKGQLVNLQPMQKVEFRVTYDGRTYLITDIR
jgi:Cu/Ag efflux protein CusF